MQPYIIRRAPYNGVKVTHFISDNLHVSRVSETRSTGRTLGGMFNVVESTGRMVKGVLRINTGSGAVDGHGTKRGHSDTIRVEPAAEIKKTVRRIRAEEMEQITRIDGDILLVEAQLKYLRKQRAEAVAAAWTKAHTVTLKELEALADLPRRSEYGLSEEQKEQVRQANDEIRRLFQN